MTKYAEKILNLINASTAHLTAEQIFLELKKSEPKIVLASVYNNLNSLYENNLIRKISVEGGSDKYDKTLKHDHLVCKKCGKLADFCFDDLTDKLQQQLNGDALGYDLKVYYICHDCRKFKNKE